MTCKDCLHFSACKNLLDTLQIVMDENAENREKHCKTFENREEYVNLPVFPTIKMLDKQMPRKPIQKNNGDIHGLLLYTLFCPSCKKQIGLEAGGDLTVVETGGKIGFKKTPKFCNHCGQGIDRSDYE